MRSTTYRLTSTPTTSWPLDANWTAKGRPILPNAITAIFTIFVPFLSCLMAGPKDQYPH
jgi:hypothetical protein